MTTAPALTFRELIALDHIAQGGTLRQLAKRLDLSTSGAGMILSREVYPKLGARNAAHAVYLAVSRGLIPPAPPPEAAP